MSDAPTPADLARWAALAEAATAGPWEARDLSDEGFDSDNRKGWWWVWRADVPTYAGVMEMDAAYLGADGVDRASIGEAEITDATDGDREKADAAFIAEARTAVPRLLALVAAQAEQIERHDDMRLARHAKAETDKARAERDAALAVVDRVRALCDEAWDPQIGGSAPIWVVDRADLRAALDGAA